MFCGCVCVVEIAHKNVVLSPAAT